MNKQKVFTILKVIGSWFLVFAIVLAGFFTGYYSGRKYVKDNQIVEDNEISAFTDSSYSWDFLSTLPYTSASGSDVWTDGSNLYYSRSSNQYVFDSASSTWSTKTWSGLSSFYGSDVWTDGSTIYYSYGNTQRVLNGSTWSTKTWSGLTNLYGSNIWTDGSNIYNSYGSSQYVLNGSTWSTKTWNGLGSYAFYGKSVWTDGSNYYAYDADEDVTLLFNFSSSSVSVYNFNIGSIYGEWVFSINGDIYYRDASQTSTYVFYTLVDGDFVSTDVPLNPSSPLFYFTFNDVSYYLQGGTMLAYTYHESQPDIPPSGDDTITTVFTSSYIPISRLGILDVGYADDIDNLYFMFSIDTTYINSSTSPFYNQYVLSVYLVANEYTFASGQVGISTGSNVSTSVSLSNSTFENPINVLVDSSNLTSVNFYRVSFSTFRDYDVNVVDDILTLTVSSDSFIKFTFSHNLNDSSIVDINLDTVGWCLANNIRSYYLNLNVPVDSEYSAGYEQGYQDGSSDGYDNGTRSGYDLGYRNGYDIGRSVGYNEGVESANTFTFYSLIGAVIDAPITAFTGMFDFTLLGVNLKDFLFGLLTLVVVIWLVGLVLGKK